MTSSSPRSSIILKSAKVFERASELERSKCALPPELVRNCLNSLDKALNSIANLELFINTKCPPTTTYLPACGGVNEQRPSAGSNTTFDANTATEASHSSRPSQLHTRWPAETIPESTNASSARACRHPLCTSTRQVWDYVSGGTKL